MDYKLLLKKYISHVEEEEGTTFIYSTEWNEKFSDEESIELERLFNEG